jgi:hypothetical protein
MMPTRMSAAREPCRSHPVDSRNVLEMTRQQRTNLTCRNVLLRCPRLPADAGKVSEHRAASLSSFRTPFKKS